MPYSRAILERFAMQAGKATQELPGFGGSVNIDAIGEQLGLSPADSRNIANYLKNIEWATVSEPNLTLTPKGFEEIAKLRRPEWRQWIDRHPITRDMVLLTATGIVAGIVSSVITSYLLK